MANWELKDLETWDRRIREKVEEFGLKCFPQEFEICDHSQMLGSMAYSGMPSHYPHWSYGKAYERLKTLYDYGVSGLPYEMVINSNPSLAYLMRDNSLCLQILTIAHVYAHNDFFRNNFTFRTTLPEYTLGNFKSHATRVRSYIEDPSIGIENVERILDAAHALSLQCRRNMAVRKLSVNEERQRILRRMEREPKRTDPDSRARDEEIIYRKIPPSPEEDLLLFIRDENPFLTEWEKDLLTIVHEEACYFIPQIETKIMNEGWASFWHREILNSLELPAELHLEFLVHHNQVVRPSPGSLNPYHVGLKVWDDIRRRFDEEAPGKGLEKLSEVRYSDRDVSFLRRFLTESLMRELDLFEYVGRGNDLLISNVSDSEGWKEVKATLIQNIGMGGVPVIKVEDAGYGRNSNLSLKHYHDGRDLHIENTERTLSYVYRLWGRPIILETVSKGKTLTLSYNEDGFSWKPFLSK
ncbi:MAG: SpoVR family protein [Opitutales bacterium]